MRVLSPLDILGRRPTVVEPSKRRLPRDGQPLVVSCGLYVDGVRVPADATDVAALLAQARIGAGFVWIGLWEPTDVEFAHIAAIFDLPPLAVEDAIRAHQRPKLERYRDLTFMIIKPARYVDRDEVIEVGELAVFVGEHFVITVRHGQSAIPAGARRLLEAKPGKLAGGPGAVLHQILDMVVDDYLEVVDAVEVDIDEIEAQVFDGSAHDHSKRIYLLKREVLEFRRAVAPLVGPLAQLAKHDLIGLDAGERMHFRDVHDHALRAAESIESYDSLLTGVLQAHLAQVSVAQNATTARQNEDMRKISAWAAIGLVPTAIAGVYGMNFDTMPELHWRYGYFAVIGLILTSCTALYVMFRRNDWL